MPSIPDVMNAIVLKGHGGLDQLHFHDDWPTPKPLPGEVLIKVGACGLNNTDVNTRSGWYSDTVAAELSAHAGAEGFSEAEADQCSWGNSSLSFPLIQGCDVVGIIADVGEAVDRARISERVMVDPWLLPTGNRFDTSRTRYYGSECNGGYADYCVIRAENALPVSSDLSDADLATFACSYITAEYLISRTSLQPGETVVISGASGGVGSAAIQLCRLRGARVIALSSPNKADLLRDLGADRVVDRSLDDLAGAISDAADGAVDVAIDVVGGPTFLALIEVLRQGGRYSSSGTIGGPMVDFDLRKLIYKDLQLTGATVAPAGVMTRIISLIEQGLLKSLLAARYPLKEFVTAQTAFMAKRHVGNIVVTMNSDA